MKLLFASAVLLVTLPVLAQLPAPNKAGVSAGHDVLGTKDVEAANKFSQALGGQPVQFVGRLNLIKFPACCFSISVEGKAPGRRPPTQRPRPNWVARKAGHWTLSGLL